MGNFFRIGNNKEGLWYNQKGEFTGLIHTKYSNLVNSKLEMPFDEELVGFISVADSMEHLYQWFSVEDIQELQKSGYKILEYESDDVKFYERFQHNVIRMETAVLVNEFTI